MVSSLLTVTETREVRPRDDSAWTVVHVAEPRHKLQTKFCYLTLSQHTDTRPNSPSADPVKSDGGQGSHSMTSV